MNNQTMEDRCEKPSLVPPIVPDTAYYDYHISRMVRKVAPPPDEDDNEALQRILDEFDRCDIVPATVQEYVTFVGPYTRDEGATMRVVMEEELSHFERLQNEVYKPLLDDTADVLMNEDLQRAKKYADEETAVNNEILDMVSQIYRMIPEFDFKEFFTNPPGYLAEVLPFPEIKNDSSDIKMQALYHRFRWMSTELSRLEIENSEMEGKLNELKTSLRKQRQKTSKAIDQADHKRQCLINKESELKAVLNDTTRKIADIEVKMTAKEREYGAEDAWEIAYEAKREKEASKHLTIEESSDESEECECGGFQE
ncbi:unnamed protein product [Brassicogethes aeneus]|uniref:Uncharacterized protein n=1 Tax=Brassicogethes aeneus TaxID=1431903 RepID=A0A9P0FQJ9_BRAAE|nr:unnamed protein product [Brassicogethes aeneus]